MSQPGYSLGDVLTMRSLCTWLWWLAVSGAGCTSPLGGGKKPNFVLIMVDDLGIGDLGCYGNTTLRTPNIDRLAQDGVKLTHHIAAAPLCTPSRAAFLTGRYPIRSGMVGTGMLGVYLFTAVSGGLPGHEVTFARLAKQQGYQTALIGKWHLGLNCESSEDHCHHPSVHGFQHFYGTIMTNLRDCQPGHSSVLLKVDHHIPYRALGLVITTTALLHCAGAITVRRGVVMGVALAVATAAALFGVFVAVFPDLNCLLMRDHDIVEQPYRSENLTQRMTQEAVHFLESNAARPFLLFFSFVQVHTALFASAPFRGSSQHGIYGDAVHEVDWSVGQLLQTVDRLGLRNDTLVYLTSDQGAHLEEISASGEVHRGWNGIYKAGKSTNWEGGIRVPGIVRWSGTLPAGREVEQPTSNMDLFPTVVKLAGAELPQDRQIDGSDLMAVLQGREEEDVPPHHEFLFHYCNAYLNAVRWHPANSSAVWKAFYFTPNFHPENETACFHTHACFCTPAYVTRHSPPLLYELSRDPQESTPLSPATEPAYHRVLEAMEAAVERHRASLEPRPGAGGGEGGTAAAESQMTRWHLVWKPWLQPCCSSPAQLCRCQRDQPPPPPEGAAG